MSEDTTPSVEDLKSRLGDEIPVEEEPEAIKAEKGQPDIVGEFRNLGRQLGETIRTAWESEERQQIQGEVQEGFKSFASELDKAFKELKDSSAAQKAKSEASEIKTKVRTGELGDKTRSGMAQGLGWLSDELARLSERFSATEGDSTEQETE